MLTVAIAWELNNGLFLFFVCVFFRLFSKSHNEHSLLLYNTLLNFYKKTQKQKR